MCCVAADKGGNYMSGRQIYFTDKELFALKELLADWEERLKPEDEETWACFLSWGYYDIRSKVKKASDKCPYYG